MKSFFSSVGAVILTSALFFSCASTSGTASIAEKLAANPSEFLSPDEGVLIYGIGPWSKDVGVSQINLEKKPAYIIPQVKSNALCGSLLCFPPVEKGVLLTPYVTRVDPKLSSKQVITRMTAEYKPLAAVADPFAKDIMGKGLTEEDAKKELLNVPEDKKIIFWDYWGVAPENYTKESEKKRATKYYWESRINALKFVQTQYKSTEWESIIEEELKSVTQEYQNVK